VDIDEGHSRTFAGRQYDKGGNLTVWWPQQMTNRFNELAQCMVEQYNTYTISKSETPVSVYTSSDSFKK